MLPLRDTIRSHRFPIITWALIGLNTLVFLFEAQLSPQALTHFVNTWGLVPAEFSLLSPLSWGRVLLSMFLHGGWFHIISNMWFLYIFGDNVEDRMGAGRYLLFYLLGGAAAALGQVLIAPGSTTPVVGASGAIAAVLGGYFVLYPTAKVTTLVPVFFFITFVDIPAVLYLGFWFVMQIFSGMAALGAPMNAGVAWWAHIGGFLFGMLAVHLFTEKEPAYHRTYPDEYWPW